MSHTRVIISKQQFDFLNSIGCVSGGRYWINSVFSRIADNDTSLAFTVTQIEDLSKEEILEMFPRFKEIFSHKKEFDIWMEGYAATGEHGTATLVGKGTGETFDEAVRDYMSKTPNHGIEEVTRNRYSSEENYNNRKSNWHIWACRLFDNEADARKSFG